MKEGGKIAEKYVGLSPKRGGGRRRRRSGKLEYNWNRSLVYLVEFLYVAELPA
jgi:hypothetical protein